MSHAYLITGVAGTGKSSLERKFSSMGYDTIDIDDGYALWQNVATHEPVPAPINESEAWYLQHDWMTDTAKLIAKINEHSHASKPLFIFGNTADLYTLHPHFKKIFALEYHDENLIHHRIHTRTDNDYGKNPAEFASLLSYYKRMQATFRSVGAIPIDCSLPISTIVKLIQQEAH